MEQYEHEMPFNHFLESKLLDECVFFQVGDNNPTTRIPNSSVTQNVSRFVVKRDIFRLVVGIAVRSG